MTAALVALFMASFEEPSVPAEMSLQNLEAAINLVKLFRVARIQLIHSKYKLKGIF